MEADKVKAHITGSDLKQAESGVTVTLGGREYPLSVDFNVVCELEDHYGSFEKAGDALGVGKVADIRFLLYAILKQTDETLTERKVGSLITVRNMKQVMDALGRAMQASVPESDGKNAESPRET